MNLKRFLTSFCLLLAGLAATAQERPKLVVGKKLYFRAAEMAQWLRALTALPKGLSSIPSNHMVAHSHL